MNATTFSVRWVYQVVSRRGLPMESGQKPALCFRGRKHALCVAAGHPVRVLKRPVEAYDKYRLVMNDLTPYPVEQAVAKFREIGERNGITVGARKLLDKAAANQHAIDEDEFNDEEEMTTMENNTPVSPTTAPATPAKETKMKTKSKSKAAKATTRKPAKAASKKSAPAKKPATKKSSGPRSGTITELVVELSKAGKSNKEIGAAVARKFPDTTFAKEVKAGDVHAVGYYRAQAVKRGWLPAPKKSK